MRISTGLSLILVFLWAGCASTRESQTPQPKPAYTETKTLKELYDNFADKYEQLITQTGYPGQQWVEKHILGMTKPDNDLNVLDLGCADGLFGKLISKHRHLKSLVGVDFSEKMIKEAALKKTYTDLYVHDLNNGLPQNVMSQQFDVILMTGFLEFISNINTLLEAVSRIAKKDALLLVTFEKETPTSRKVIIDTPKHFYSEEKVRTLLANAHFDVLSLEDMVGYKESKTGNEVRYFFVVAKKNR